MFLLSTIGSYSFLSQLKTHVYKQFRERQKTCQEDSIPSSTDNKTDYISSACKRGAKR